MGSKSDLVQHRQVLAAEGQELAQRLNALFYECSAIDSVQSTRVFMESARAGLNIDLQTPNITSLKPKIQARFRALLVDTTVLDLSGLGKKLFGECFRFCLFLCFANS